MKETGEVERSDFALVSHPKSKLKRESEFGEKCAGPLHGTISYERRIFRQRWTPPCQDIHISYLKENHYYISWGSLWLSRTPLLIIVETQMLCRTSSVLADSRPSTCPRQRAPQCL